MSATVTGRPRAAGGGRGGRAERGMTMVELLVYLGLMTTFLGTIAGADQLARRLYRRDSALIAGFQARERVLSALEADFDRARAVSLGGGANAVATFAGGASYRFAPGSAGGIVERDGKAIAGGVTDLRLEAVPGSPGLYEATLVTGAASAAPRERADGARTYTRRFFLRNGEGTPRGWN